MKKSKAIHILKNQIKKLENEQNLNYSWTLETKTYIVKFFGKDSPQESYIKYFDWQPTIADRPIDKREGIKAFVNDCINTIDNIGIKKDPKQNILNRIPDWSIIPIVTALVFIGGVFGRYNKDIAYIRMEEKIEILKDSISTISIFKKAYNPIQVKKKSNIK
ncbi:hypothetical protein [Winogradskyella sp. UBA3174]|uniref:hypothetical protein n=1 Tax=Winogradskyella sp. UBA3174 TaxID=1947785 RepID=UPI0025CDE299|nr:hypothetical protein [Winogradskyella sp. UBA3174]|tara:strand:- start:9829 stop:10314 length:486 start_codon:yes stop_codon:yes gene_type:complete